MRQKLQIACGDELTDKQLLMTAAGEIARGMVYLTYSTDSGDVVANVPIDTHAGPDGLMTGVDVSLGEWVYARRVDGQTAEVLATERVIQDAKDAYHAADGVPMETGIWNDL